MKFMIVIFVILTLIMLISGHAGLWFSIIKFFGITSSVAKKILLIVFGVMSVSFLVSTLLVHWHETVFTEKLYLFSGIWLGAIWYIALAIAATWIFYWIGKWTDVEMPLGIIATIFISMAIAYSIYGVVNAFTPLVINREIKISNLPTEWQGKKIVQLSDIHLGTIHNKKYMRKIVKETNDLNPDLVVITGDLFDGAGQKLNHMSEPINNINAPLGVYVIIGNHETYLSLDKSIKAIKDTKANLLRDELVEINGIQLVGIDYPMPGQEHDIEGILNKIDKNKPSIVLYHEPKESVWEQIKQAGGDLVLSGHTHKGQMWPFGGVSWLVYGNYHYGLNKSDEMYINTSSGVGTWGPPMRTGSHSEIIVLTLK